MDKKVCFITGGSAGIGASLVECYARSNYHVVFTGRREQKIQEVRSHCSKFNSEVVITGMNADVTDKEAMLNCVSKILTLHGRIDLLVANAGYVVGGKFDELETQNYRQQFETNVFGVIDSIKYVADEIKKTKGSIAIIGSVNSYVSPPTVSAYAMSKHAIRSLADCLYHEYKKHGVSVTLICPGFVKSDIRTRKADGYVDETQKDEFNWLAMDTMVAAKKIFHAIEKRKKEKIVTIHGHVAIYLKRFFPFLMSVVFRLQKRQLKN